MNNNTSNFYQEKPLFGLDIGYDSIKVMQIDSRGGKSRVIGYGVAPFDPSAIAENGVISNHEVIAKAIFDLFDNKIIGEINTNRVCMAVPAGRTYTRNFKLPLESKDNIEDAVRLETEQFVPIPINDLYFDWNTTSEDSKSLELLTVATPNRIVDSYMELAAILGLEVAAIETTTAASGRLFAKADHNDIPTVLLDFGSISSDVTIFDGGLIVSGAVPGGGDSFNQSISSKLSISREEAHIVKTKYGLGVSKKQKEIIEALTPMLAEMLKEIKRIIRYYEERSGTNQDIGQVVTMGGGANMPGLSDHMTNLLRLPVRMCEPWSYLTFKGISPPNSVEKSMYVTVAGLALITSEEIMDD
jgi:type IV pilus assembly protein PilM